LQPRISSFPPEVKSFDEYSSSLESFMSLSTYRIEELRGSLLLVMSPPFISILTNAYYGGNIEILKTNRQEFTATEERIIEMASDGLMRELKTSWKDLTPINFSKIGREVNPQFTTFVDASDLVIICSFVVQLPGVDAANFDILYPLQTLKPIASLLRSRVQSDIVEDDTSWRDKLEKAVLEIPLKINATLSEPIVNFSKLLRLNVGNTLQIPISDKIDVYVEDIKMFNGDLGEYKGNSAINVKKRI
ncbi:MAG: flagellar motor switch protein FliM, partial [Pelagibacterales bacterium]|nr:flagellar motor switch protein FliM [Pelagibacterales bacterium]